VIVINSEVEERTVANLRVASLWNVTALDRMDHTESATASALPEKINRRAWGDPDGCFDYTSSATSTGITAAASPTTS